METIIKDDRIPTQLGSCCFTCRHLVTNHKTAYDECKRDGDEPTYYYDLGDITGGLDRFIKKCPRWECSHQMDNKGE